MESREIRLTSETGGEKGTKPERYDLLPYEALDEIARVYGYGAEKYAPNNWRKGYRWGLSLASALRHISLWVQRESYDQETGLHHLAHAAFHLFAIITWENGVDSDRYARYDDRANVIQLTEEQT